MGSQRAGHNWATFTFYKKAASNQFSTQVYEPALRKQKQPCSVAFVDLCHVNTPIMVDFKDGSI